MAVWSLGREAAGEPGVPAQAPQELAFLSAPDTRKLRKLLGMFKLLALGQAGAVLLSWSSRQSMVDGQRCVHRRQGRSWYSLTSPETVPGLCLEEAPPGSLGEALAMDRATRRCSPRVSACPRKSRS